MKSIKLTVEEIINRTGRSQADIARSLGVPEKTLNAWLTGRVTCRHEQMLGLALEALSARLKSESKLKTERGKFKMGRIIADTVITKTQTHRLTAESSGTGGRRLLAIYLDGQSEPVDYLDEWLDSWYHKLEEKPTERDKKIGSTPEEALNWWVRSRGFTFSEGDKTMKQARTSAEFEQYARDKGHMVENGNVIFNYDSEAARAFEAEAHKAGFSVIRGFAQAAWGNPPTSEMQKDWYVTLVGSSE